MGKLLRGLIVFVLLIALLVGGLYWYVQPQTALDLTYTDLSVRNKLTEMLASRKLEVELSEPEVNDLLKKALVTRNSNSASNRGEIEITGARFTLHGNELIADVSLLYKKQWRIGAVLQFAVSWQEPYVTAVHTGTRIRQMNLPLEWFQLKPIQVPLNDYMPKVAGIKSITFLEHSLKLSLALKLR
ncbi:hypothetical protein GC093_24055 [Paenibacillus sp. LMG 31456]|uniref:Uncharacterized protein n=1 Tax=Paenibacillus foliorum TaxID=2654974 RepID=A0A972H4P2_9BACL|nr:hypothetical protein [Paenibacillus foliorum]NOU96271.1 hypothetical protein [Paenibacillus foliorum]